jgi:predicted nucleotidyltransferase
MDKVVYTEREMSLIDPKPGTAAAAARDFGIDLSLTVSNLRLTPEERIKRLDESQASIKELRKASLNRKAMDEAVAALKLLSEFDVEFVVIGGVAAGAHGLSNVGFDVDICYSRTPANLAKVVNALRSAHAKLRDVPHETPFILNEESLHRDLNFKFETDIGNLDLHGQVQGVGDYGDCLRDSDEIEMSGHLVRLLSLRQLIASKRASGRPKDLLVLPELEAIIKQGRVNEASAPQNQ